MQKKRSAREMFQECLPEDEETDSFISPSITSNVASSISPPPPSIKPPSPSPSLVMAKQAPGFGAENAPVDAKFKKSFVKEDKPIMQEQSLSSQTQQRYLDIPQPKTSEELQLEKGVIAVRETGFFMWRTIVVPPNTYVIHTRKGQKEPITLGLGISFSFNPYTDSYLVVPSAMQTIGIVANCITKEKQGINILAYVQWLISDFSIAYKKLDFSDHQDPVGIVNAQLREQAEAAIKDKIATMSVEDVLTDKEPIIEELTTRMKTVAEGRGKEGTEGLGLKIVTVQIKEAIVSSPSLWKNLQAPFRNEKEKEAQISGLLSAEEIHKGTMENQLTRELRESKTSTDIAKFKSEKQTETFEVEQKELARRLNIQHNEERKKIQLQEETTLLKRQSERKLQKDEEEAVKLFKLEELKRKEELEKLELEFEKEHSLRQKELYEINYELDKLSSQNEYLLNKLTKESEFELTELEHKSKVKIIEELNEVNNEQKEREIKFQREEESIKNNQSQANLTAQIIEQLPAIAENMPKIDELKTIQISNNENNPVDMFSTFLVKLLSVADSLGIKLPTHKNNQEQ